MGNLLAALPSTRPPFLILAPLCVGLGTSLSIFHGNQLNTLHFLLAMLGATLAAVAVNTLNEYQDFHSGLDLNTTQTPFSGGSGLLKNQQHLSTSVLRLFQLSIAGLVSIGCYFVWQYELPMLVIGLIGLAVIVTYTKVLNRHPWLCLISPGVGFGLLMVVGSYLVQSGQVTLSVLAVALIPFFVINNLLLINQLPDIAADKQAGRNHMAIHYSVNFSILCFVVSALLAICVLILLVYLGVLPSVALWCVPILLLNLVALPKLFSLGGNIAMHLPSMGVNVLAANLLPLVLSLVLIFSGS